MQRARKDRRLRLAALLRPVILMVFGILRPDAGIAQAVPAIISQVPQGSPLRHIQPAPRPLPNPGLPRFRPLSAEGAVPDISVPVNSVSIIGATAFPAPRLAALTAGLPDHR